MSRGGMSPYIICWGPLAAWLAPGGAWLSQGEGALLQQLKSSPQGLARPLGERLQSSSPTLREVEEGAVRKREEWCGPGVEKVVFLPNLVLTPVLPTPTPFTLHFCFLPLPLLALLSSLTFLFSPPPLSVTSSSFPTVSLHPTPPPMSLCLATELHPAQPVAAHPFHPRAERGHGQELMVDAEP